MQPAFTAKPALSVAAERTRRVKLVIGICPDHTRAQFAHDLEDLAPLVGPNPRAQSIRRVVCALDRFLRRAKRHDAQDWAEDFFLGDAMGGGHPGKKAWRIPVTLVG